MKKRKLIILLKSISLVRRIEKLLIKLLINYIIKINLSKLLN